MIEDGRARPRPDASPAAPSVERAAHRHKTFEPATIVTPAGERRAHVLNLSATGALVHAAVAPAPGERCTVRLSGRDLAGEVMWVDGARFGIAFRGMLCADDLAHLLG